MISLKTLIIKPIYKHDTDTSHITPVNLVRVCRHTGMLQTHFHMNT